MSQSEDEAKQPLTLTEAIPLLQKEKAALEIAVERIEQKGAHLEAAAAENIQLKVKVSELLQEVKKLEAEEWLRKETYFPDIYLRMMKALGKKLGLDVNPQQAEPSSDK